jgi:uncharacterized protein (DUF433 family)
MPRVHYAIADDQQLKGVKFAGRAASTGGHRPRVPLDHVSYSLLAWTHHGHPKHGHDVFTEDGKASVTAIAQAAAESPSIDALAAKFGTSRAHVIQALDYAVEAGYLATNGG